MDKYRSLIEFIKKEYGVAYYEEESTINTLNDFDISITSSKNKKSIAKYFEIKEKKDDKQWSFIVCPSSYLYATNFKKYREQLLEDNNITGIFTLKNIFLSIVLFQ